MEVAAQLDFTLAFQASFPVPSHAEMCAQAGENELADDTTNLEA